MLKRWMMVLVVAIAFVFSAQAWALEMESGEDNASKLHMHGYGELHYNVPSGGNSKMDLHRMVWGLSYEFSDRISVHTEVDFEHAAQEMELEYAYIDFLINPALNVRAGLMLMPVGHLNEYHEPVLFYSVERPVVQKVIIPTTWQEGGVGIFGSPMEGLRYRLYLVSGLAGQGFRAKDGIRKGRGKVDGGEAHPQTGEELAIVARLDYSPMLGVDLGASFYNGGVDQVNNIGGNPSVTILEADIRVQSSGVDFLAVYTQIDVDDAAQINADRVDSNGISTPLTGNKSVGEELVGWYVELAYHLSHTLQTDWDLVPFIRISEVNTQDAVPTGFTANPRNDREITTYGLAYFPEPQVAIKADFQTTEYGTGPDTDQYNFGIAYMF